MGERLFAPIISRISNGAGEFIIGGEKNIRTADKTLQMMTKVQKYFRNSA